jgi:hypothetical protein
MAIGPLIAFSPLLGKAGAESGYSHWLIMPPIRANAMSGSPLAIYATGSGDCRICSVRQNTIGTGATSTTRTLRGRASLALPCFHDVEIFLSVKGMIDRISIYGWNFIQSRITTLRVWL